MFFGSKKYFRCPEYFFSRSKFFFGKISEFSQKIRQMLDFEEFSKKPKLEKFWKFEDFGNSPDFFRWFFFKLFFNSTYFFLYSKLEIFPNMYFDSEFFGLSNGAISRAIPALLPSIQTALVTTCVSKLEHFDEIRWAGYMGSDSRRGSQNRSANEIWCIKKFDQGILIVHKLNEVT